MSSLYIIRDLILKKDNVLELYNKEIIRVELFRLFNAQNIIIDYLIEYFNSNDINILVFLKKIKNVKMVFIFGQKFL